MGTHNVLNIFSQKFTPWYIHPDPLVFLGQSQANVLMAKTPIPIVKFVRSSYCILSKYSRNNRKRDLNDKIIIIIIIISKSPVARP
jgi:hypothetical protein